MKKKTVVIKPHKEEVKRACVHCGAYLDLDEGYVDLVYPDEPTKHCCDIECALAHLADEGIAGFDRFDAQKTTLALTIEQEG